MHSRLFHPQDDDDNVVLRRHAGATLIPASLERDGKKNDTPLSFAVSPYAAIEFQPASPEATYETRLISAELLCLDNATGTLRPTASQLQEMDGADHLAFSLAWARETHRRLSPASPIAILRFRNLNERVGDPNDTGAMLTTSYAFTIVPDIELPEPLTKPLARLRSAVDTLRFREGQFGGSRLPADVQAFELAPPQTIGVQPI
jgi:hypothetical protein